MREDMSKVLVEEPRGGQAYARAVAGCRRRRRNALDPDGEGGPPRLGMKSEGLAYKGFGEHLGPLYRYLRQQVDRPWDKVWSELCAGLDRRNVVQAHLFQHIDDRVARRTTLVDGEVRVHDRWSRTVPLAEARQEMYVHPRTGLLRVNRARERALRQRQLDREEALRDAHADRRTDIPGLPPDRQWHRIDGLWYEIGLGRWAPGERIFDVVLRRVVDDRSGRLATWRLYGRQDVVGVSKRQLDGRTLARHGLR